MATSASANAGKNQEKHTPTHVASEATAIKIPTSALGKEEAAARQTTQHYLKALREAKQSEVDQVLIVPGEDRLKDKLALLVARQMELVQGGDLTREVLDPVRVSGEWALVLTRQQRPKADRDRVKLELVLLNNVDDEWRVVPDVVHSDPTLNVSRNHDAQALLRWFRRHQQQWHKKYVAPLIQGGMLPDAMRHLARAPRFDIDTLRDPFASYLAAVAKNNEQVLQRRKANLASRPREALEAFDLSTLHLVAIYSMGGKRVAMLEDSEGKGHVVTVGNYMGKYNGKITAIDANAVHLSEEVMNPAGAVVHKEVLMALIDANENKK
ncbi:MAG: pilus assembly protein PilP [Mariprofundales bacterium]